MIAVYRAFIQVTSLRRPAAGSRGVIRNRTVGPLSNVQDDESIPHMVMGRATVLWVEAPLQATKTPGASLTARSRPPVHRHANDVTRRVPVPAVGASPA